MGKNKIEIKKIENPNARQVCFSKRRKGIFKKASDLCIMCNAEIGIIVFSPAGKVFTFGCPNIDLVLDRFLSIPPGDNDKIQQYLQLEKQHHSILKELDFLKKRNEHLQKSLSNNFSCSWWTMDFQCFDLPSLQMFLQQLLTLRQKFLLASHTQAQAQAQAEAQAQFQLFSATSSSSSGYFHPLRQDKFNLFKTQNEALPLSLSLAHCDSSSGLLFYNHPIAAVADVNNNGSHFRSYATIAGFEDEITCRKDHNSKCSFPESSKEESSFPQRPSSSSVEPWDLQSIVMSCRSLR